MMKYSSITVLIKLLIPLLIHSWMPVAVAEDGPIIHIDPISHAFPSAFEGVTLSHDFVVTNRGSNDLEVKDVTHQ
jgi:hypothetical protein